MDKLLVTYHNRLVGTLMMSQNSESVVFQYADEWLAGGFSTAAMT